jgi:hypothetical protein
VTYRAVNAVVDKATVIVAEDFEDVHRAEQAWGGH